MATILNKFGNNVAVAVVAVLVSQSVVLAKGHGHGGGGGGPQVSIARSSAPRMMSNPVKSFNTQGFNKLKVSNATPFRASQAIVPSQSKSYLPYAGNLKTANSRFVTSNTGLQNAGIKTKITDKVTTTTSSSILQNGGTKLRNKASDYKPLPSSPTHQIPGLGNNSGIVRKSKFDSKILDKIGGPVGGNTGGGGGAGGGPSSPSQPSTPSKPPCPKDNCKHDCGFPFPFPYPFPVGCGFGNWGVGGSVIYTPAVVAEAPVVVAEQPVVQGSGNVDLVLEDIQLSQPATLIAGPAYRVKFRNQGLQAAGQFRVAVLAALDGQMTDAKAIVDVPGLAAGEAREVTLRLPAMKLVSTSIATPVAFSHLVVAVDPDSAVVEADKTNNVAAIERIVLEQ